jgi:hypothetical protein
MNPMRGEEPMVHDFETNQPRKILEGSSQSTLTESLFKQTSRLCQNWSQSGRLIDPRRQLHVASELYGIMP